MRRSLFLALGCLWLAAAARAAGPEAVGQVATLPSFENGAHWVWVPDRLLQHSKLYDGDDGQVLGIIDSGISLSPKPPLLSRKRGEFYSVDLAYTRGKRGERLDFITIYDAARLDVTGEILLPTRTAETNQNLALATLLDDERFLLLFNQSPNVSVSVVDVERRRFVEEIILSGCGGVYPVSARRFATLCGDGTALMVELDDQGRKAGQARTGRFFDVVEDPVQLSAGRDGSRLFFVSFLGQVHAIDFAGQEPDVQAPWSLVTEGEAPWRPGGLQQIALHRQSGRLYAVMHRGKPGSHKDPGPEVWVFAVAERTRVGRFAVPNLTAAFLGGMMGIEGGFSGWLMQRLLPDAGAHSIAVTQDEAPLLFARNAELGVVAVLDATTGDHLRDLTEAGLAGPTLEVP